MALSSPLFTEESPGKNALKRCSETHAGHLLRGMSTPPDIKDAIARVQRALKQLGLSVSDPPGVFGGSTELAVLKFKGPPRNILGPGQKKPDAIVGIQTITQLDAAIGGGKAPVAPPQDTKSTNWSFTFFGDKGFAGPGRYTLDIISGEHPDSQRFSMSELFADESLIGGFRGSTFGRFVTPRSLNATDFHAAISKLFIEKNRTVLNGNLELRVATQGFNVNLKFTEFREQRSLGGALTSGTLAVSGQITRQ